MCFQNILKKILSPKIVCWHDTEGEHFVQARCSRNRLWSRTPLCLFNTCMSACLENLQKEILSPKMCVDIFFFWFFFKYTKVSYFYFLEDSAKFHRNIPYVLYALKCACFQNILKKNSKSKNVCWHDTEGEHFVQARCSRNRLWSRTPLCWFNTLHVRVFRKFAEKNYKSKNMCWNFIDFFFKYIKAWCCYFLKDSAKFHRNIYYVLYTLTLTCGWVGKVRRRKVGTVEKESASRAPARPGARPRNLSRDRLGSPAARFLGGCLDKLAFPCL